MKTTSILHAIVWLLSVGCAPSASKTRHQRHNNNNNQNNNNQKTGLASSSSSSKSGSDDFLVSYVNATVFLGCHLADPEIIWLLDGEDVEEYIDYRVKEEVALSPADFDVSGVLLGDEGAGRKPRERKLVGQR